jgi:hypothetical protein
MAKAWHQVKPHILAEIEDVKVELCTCKPEHLIRLQERVRALHGVISLFEYNSSDPAQMISGDVTYG